MFYLLKKSISFFWDYKIWLNLFYKKLLFSTKQKIEGKKKKKP